MPKWKIALWNLWPPFLGAGIRIGPVAEDLSWIEATLTLYPWNRNYIGTMFGGSLYSLCDPFHMVLLIQQLGRGYVVRDKGAEIRFLKKGTKRVRARFYVTPEELDSIRRDPREVQERRFLAQVKSDDGAEVLAEVTKILHIRRITAGRASATTD